MKTLFVLTKCLIIFTQIAQDAAIRSKDQKAIRAGSDQEQLLNQTEKNLKFGIFSLTLQYFRSMTLVRRQFETMSGRKAAAGLEGKQIVRDISEERRRMNEEQNQLDARLKRTELAEKKAILGMQPHALMRTVGNPRKLSNMPADR